MRSILITGCSSGIGYVTAHTLQQRGWRVFATARKHMDVDRLQSEGLESFHLDLQNEASIDAAVDQALARTGGSLEAVFNNGAYGQAGALEDLPTQAIREEFEANFLGWHHLTRRVIPVMRGQGRGRIVQNSSILGFMALKFRGPYTASKYALEGYTDTLRLELAGSGIHVSLVEPGPILTRFRANSLEAFMRWVDMEASPHRATYEASRRRMEAEGAAAPFTLGPEAVSNKVIHALEARRPKIRYYVTFPTYLFAYLKRLLPQRAYDRLCAGASGG